MSEHYPRFSAVCLTILCLGSSLLAQTRGYHMELSDRTSGRVILVNDSEKPMEAFHVSAKCGDAANGPVTQSMYDSLASSGNELSYDQPDGKTVRQKDVIAPKGRLISMITLNPQPSSCEWHADIDAVIYSNGSYEGDEMAARDIQARRDGTAEGVRYWTDRFHRESTDTLRIDVMIDQARNFSEVARSNGSCIVPSLACEYWMGRATVDMGVAVWLKGSKADSADYRYKQTVELMERWQRKVDSDKALERLDIIFSLPAPLTRQIIQWKQWERYAMPKQ